jgi:DNA-binding transcriptional ArsR family regulator
VPGRSSAAASKRAGSERTSQSSFNDPRFVKALAHPLRVSILARLQERRATPRELAEWLDASLGVVSYHVRTLHNLGVIELVATTQVRGAIAHHYRAKERPRIPDEAWAAASPIAKQAAVAASLATIAEYANASAAAGGLEREDAKLNRGRLRLDAKGWEKASEAYLKLLVRLGEIEGSAQKRIAKDPHAEGVSDAALVLMLFEGMRGSDAAD